MSGLHPVAAAAAAASPVNKRQKKRGRPSKAELERRRREQEQEEAEAETHFDEFEEYVSVNGLPVVVARNNDPASGRCVDFRVCLWCRVCEQLLSYDELGDHLKLTHSTPVTDCAAESCVGDRFESFSYKSHVESKHYEVECQRCRIKFNILGGYMVL